MLEVRIQRAIGAVERAIPARNVPRGQSPMELLTPREISQTTEVRPTTTVGTVTIPVVEQRLRKLIDCNLWNNR